MPDRVEVKVKSGDYLRAMDLFLPATLVEFGEGYMRAHVPRRVVIILEEQEIPHEIVE